MSWKRWILPELPRETAARLSEEAEIPPFLALLLATRGIDTAEEAQAFLSDEMPEADPFALADMEAAVACIQDALDRHRRIAVYGDYDADGITATALLYTYLKSLGADVTYYLPHRETDGYGLHKESLERLFQDGVQLVVTVDTGITAVEEAAYAAALGMELVITDHHKPQEPLPAACAVVDPHRADCPSVFKDYAGVGVALLLVCALEGDDESVFDRFSDLAALGTLADVMPLRGFNRALVRRGLKKLNESPCAGLKQLAVVSGMAGKPHTASSTVFSLAPRLNAAGRMGAPEVALKLLLCENSEDALLLATDLNRLNTERQEIENVLLKEAVEQVEKDPSLAAQRVIVVAGRDWNNGVTGIIAARLLERYGKPCIVVSEGEGGIAKGSGRSLRGFSLFEAVEACADVLIAFGGHEMAAGLTLESARIEEFRVAINAYAAAKCPTMPMPELRLDCRLRPDQLTAEKADQLAVLQPCGTGNAFPVFGLFHMRVDASVPVGNGKHARLTLSRGQTRVTAIKFGITSERLGFSAGDEVDIAVTLDRSAYPGQAVSVVIRDIRFSDTDQDILAEALCRRDALLRGESTADTPPSREELARVYRTLISGNGWEGTLEQLTRVFRPDILPSKVLAATEILRQGGLIAVQWDGDCWQFTAVPVNGKTDLTCTPAYQVLLKGNSDASSGNAHCGTERTDR